MKQRLSIAHRVSKGKYNLTTNARRKAAGGNKQVDDNAGRQTWKCHDPLNYVAAVAFRRHGASSTLRTLRKRGAVAANVLSLQPRVTSPEVQAKP